MPSCLATVQRIGGCDMRGSSRFCVPAPDLSLGALGRRAQRAALMSLAVAALLHLSLVKLVRSEWESQVAKPLTIWRA